MFFFCGVSHSIFCYALSAFGVATHSARSDCQCVYLVDVVCNSFSFCFLFVSLCSSIYEYECLYSVWPHYSSRFL